MDPASCLFSAATRSLESLSNSKNIQTPTPPYFNLALRESPLSVRLADGNLQGLAVLFDLAPAVLELASLVLEGELLLIGMALRILMLLLRDAFELRTQLLQFLVRLHDKINIL